MKQFNVTAQVYNKFDTYKQTMLMNEVVSASSEEEAIKTFQKIFEPDYKVVKVYSAELLMA